MLVLSDHALCVAPVLIYPGTTRKRATYHHSSGWYAVIWWCSKMHHAQSVIYNMMLVPMPSTWCPARGGLDTHANCVKVEGVVYIHHVQGTVSKVTLILLFSWLHIPESSDSVHSAVRQSLPFSWDPCHPMTIPGPRCGLNLQSAYVPPDCFSTAYGAMVV